MTKKRMLATSIALVFIGTGCGADRGYVQREWSTTLRELGIVPVFPPREDVYVGDIYAYEYDPESAEVRRVFETNWGSLSDKDRALRERIGMSPRLARIAKLNNLASREYGNTPSFPSSTPESVGVLSGTNAVAAAEAAAKRLKEALTAESGQKAAVEDAQRVFDSASGTVTALSKEIAELEKVPDKETEAQREERLKKLKAKQEEKTKADKALAEPRTALAKSKALLGHFEQETKNAAAAHETAQKNLAAWPAMFQQPTDRHANVFDGRTLPGTEPEKDRVNRLRLVGFPDFASTSFTKGDLSSLVPIEAFTLGLGLDFSRVRRVSVRVPAAESYGLSLAEVIDESAGLVEPVADIPGVIERSVLARADTRIQSLLGDCDNAREVADAIHRAMREAVAALRDWPEPKRIGPWNKYVLFVADDAATGDCPLQLPRVGDAVVEELSAAVNLFQWFSRRGDTRGHMINPRLAMHLGLMNPGQIDKAGRGEVFLRVPTEVFYARSLDVSVFVASSFGGRVNLSAVPKEGTTPAAQSSPSSVDPDTATGSELVAAASASIGQTRSDPGGTVQLVSMAEHAVGVRRTYQRPVAIGFRGLTLRVDVTTGIVLNIQPSSGGPSVR